MSHYDWYTLLTQWSKEILESEDSKYFDLPPDAIDSGWLGYPGATDEQIAAAEVRLGCTLPPSYCEFLKVTNGWRRTGYCIDKLWSTEMIDWHYARNASTVDGWIEGEARAERNGWSILDEEYNVYSEAQTSMIRGQHFKSTLEISQYFDGIYLLNPLTINVDGEWEAWFFAYWIPGAQRYQTFWDLMQGEYQKFRRAK
ncbi:MAG: SMI1/KNR4 family protein [Anaerolineae bacterium]|nr:SMI1/KNR4 family protein [Anaerolineae bacterium]